jgi:predicted O-methyltransferase YrrM
MNLQRLWRWPAALARRVGLASSYPHEWQRLMAVPRVACPEVALGSVSADLLRDIFASPELGNAWRADRPERDAWQLPELTGGVNPGDQRALYYLVLALRPRSILEIGTHVGCSTIHLALALRRLPDPQRQLVSVDLRDVNDPETQPWLAGGGRHSPLAMCRQAGCGDWVDFPVRDSLRFLMEHGRSFDWIFLDGSHEADHLYQEIPLALRRLSAGGVILLHDYFPRLKPLWAESAVIPGPWLAVRRLRREGARFSVRPLGTLPWPTKLGTRATSLAVLAQA